MGQNLGFIYTRTHLWRQDQEANGGLADEGGFAAPIVLWSALDRAGPCCKAFAESVPKAATVIAGQATTAGTYPWSAGLRVRYLSKLEQDTMLRLH